jgi:thioredoxin-related protein
MKQLTSLFWALCLLHLGTNAQQTVTVTVTLKGGANLSGPLAVLAETEVSYLEPSQEPFKAAFTVEQLPTFVRFATISKKGKVTPSTTEIWIDHPDVRLEIDLAAQKAVSNKPYARQDLADKLATTSGQEKISLIRQHADTYPAIYHLYELAMRNQVSVAESEAIFRLVPDDKKSYRYAKQIGGYLLGKQLPPLAIGQAVTPLELQDHNRKPRTLGNPTKKHRLLMVASSGCQFCLTALPEAAKLNTEMAETLEVVTVWTDPTYHVWQNAAKEAKRLVTWIDLWDETGVANAYFKVGATPAFFLIDRNGVVVARTEGYRNGDLEKFVKKNVK